MKQFPSRSWIGWTGRISKSLASRALRAPEPSQSFVSFKDLPHINYYKQVVCEVEDNYSCGLRPIPNEYIGFQIPAMVKKRARTPSKTQV